jgi:hypothetical protein
MDCFSSPFEVILLGRIIMAFNYYGRSFYFALFYAYNHTIALAISLQDCPILPISKKLTHPSKKIDFPFDIYPVPSCGYPSTIIT